MMAEPGMGHIDRAVRLEYHLRYNHYPPVPREMFPFIERAIELGRTNDFISVEVGDEIRTLERDGFHVTAAELIAQFHLDMFVEEQEEHDG
jgi:hypothetical protein